MDLSFSLTVYVMQFRALRCGLRNLCPQENSYHQCVMRVRALESAIPLRATNS